MYATDPDMTDQSDVILVRVHFGNNNKCTALLRLLGDSLCKILAYLRCHRDFRPSLQRRDQLSCSHRLKQCTHNIST